MLERIHEDSLDDTSSTTSPYEALSSSADVRDASLMALCVDVRQKHNRAQRWNAVAGTTIGALACLFPVSGPMLTGMADPVKADDAAVTLTREEVAIGSTKVPRRTRASGPERRGEYPPAQVLSHRER